MFRSFKEFLNEFELEGEVITPNMQEGDYIVIYNNLSHSIKLKVCKITQGLKDVTSDGKLMYILFDNYDPLDVEDIISDNNVEFEKPYDYVVPECFGNLDIECNVVNQKIGINELQQYKKTTKTIVVLDEVMGKVLPNYHKVTVWE